MADRRYEDERWADLDDDGEPVPLMRWVFTGGRMLPATDLPDIAMYEPSEAG